MSGGVNVVVDCGRVVGVSLSAQGAEALRVSEARRIADEATRDRAHCKAHSEYERAAYGRMHIEDHDLQGAQ